LVKASARASRSSSFGSDLGWLSDDYYTKSSEYESGLGPALSARSICHSTDLELT